MITPKKLAESFALNARLIARHAADLSHANSLAQSKYDTNCLNWVLGHILVSRDAVLGLLDEAPALNEAERTRYRSGSAPVTADDEEVVRLDRLLRALDIGQERLASGLVKLSADYLKREIQDGDRRVSLAERIHGFYFHDTYHTGQIEILRQLASGSG